MTLSNQIRARRRVDFWLICILLARNNSSRDAGTKNVLEKLIHLFPQNIIQLLFKWSKWNVYLKLLVLISGKVFAQNYKFSNKNNILPARRGFKKKILDHFSPSFLG